MRRRLAVTVGAALVATLLPAAATAQEAPAEGQVVYALAVPDGAGGDTFDGFAAAALDGTNQRRITATPQPAGDDAVVDRFPRWSPDGRWVTFTRRTGEDLNQPMAVSADGGEPMLLADHGAKPSWSRDGSLLVWTTKEPAPAVVVAQVTGTDPQLALGERRTIDVPHPPSGAALSPSGDRVLFRMDRASGPGADLWTVGIDGSDLRQITSDVDASAGQSHGHAWSPDGTKVTFVGADAAARGGRRAHIVNSDGTEQRLLFPANECEYTRTATWAPHGEFLALLSNCHDLGLQLVTPTGQLLGSVGAGPHRFGGFAFAPDAAHLYAVTVPDETASDTAQRQLQRIPLDGSAPTSLLTTPAPARTPIDIVSTAEVTPRVVRPPDSQPDPDPASIRRPRLEHACPVDEVPYADFLDVELESPHRAAIDCMAWWDVVSGIGEFAYGPTEGVSRQQMATLLTRLIAAGGTPLPSTTTNYFIDDASSPHHDNINRLAEAGIVKGDAEGRFRPAAPVAREQMATLIVATYDYIGSVALTPASGDYFDDDATSVHQGAINLAAEAGFVTGVSDRSYAPHEPERREHAAARAARVLDALVEHGDVNRPRNGLARVTRVVDGDTILANDPEIGTIRIRFVGINAMEQDTCGADAATAALAELVLGKSIRLSSDDPSSIGRMRRPLRFVEVLKDGDWIDVNAEMLARGHALWFPNEDGKEPRNNNAYQRAARQAAIEGSNIWNPTTCGRGPQQGAQLKLWVSANPAGPDEQNVNGEWIRIQNTGSVGVDLYRWKIRDSSLQTPYQFANHSILPAGGSMTVHVGAGADEPLVRYWGRDNALFANARRVSGQWIGDGAYLLDPDGDIRAHFMYPCAGACTDPLVGQVTISEVSYDPEGDENLRPNDEFVVIRNVTDAPVSLYGYRLTAGARSYHFPDTADVAAGASLTIRVGQGHDSPWAKHWGHTSAILDDSNGSVKLRTYDGITIACSAWGATLC